MGKNGSSVGYRFSVSDIVSAFHCPLQFYFRKKGIKAYFRYGNVHIGSFVHNVLSVFAKEIEKPTLFNERREGYIERKLYQAFLSVSISKHYNVDFEEGWRYLKSIGAYFENLAYKKSIPEIKEMFLLSEESFLIRLAGAYISGRFDLLLDIGNDIRIIDYKTRGKEIDIDAVQIAIYRYAVEKIYKKRASPYVLYIGDGEMSEEYFSDEEYIELMKQINKEIMDMKDFLEGNKIPLPTPERSLCRYCSIQYHCEELIKKFFT